MDTATQPMTANLDMPMPPDDEARPVRIGARKVDAAAGRRIEWQEFGQGVVTRRGALYTIRFADGITLTPKEFAEHAARVEKEDADYLVWVDWGEGQNRAILTHIDPRMMRVCMFGRLPE